MPRPRQLKNAGINSNASKTNLDNNTSSKAIRLEANNNNNEWFCECLYPYL